MSGAQARAGAPPRVLAMNGGSSSIRFALYHLGETPERLLRGHLERIGLKGTSLTIDDPARPRTGPRNIGNLDPPTAARYLIDWLDLQVGLGALTAAGHRIVSGGAAFTGPQPITGQLLEQLHRLTGAAPEHLPSELAMIDLIGERAPSLLQVACFDTAFHRDMPRVAKLLPIPRRFQTRGVERYGFHGLSYSYLMEELVRTAGPEAAHGRVILAHLGNGASLTAVRGGQCMDTTMGFTPTGGIPMSTRSGDLDPGLVGYLARTEQMTAEQFDRMATHESGMLGVSETSSDLRDLLQREAEDVRAAEAVALFCYHITKGIGAYAAALGGLDTLLFAGGIGENAAVIRARICENLGFLGIRLDGDRNANGAPVISTAASPTTVRIIRTDEELMIAKLVGRLLAGTDP